MWLGGSNGQFGLESVLNLREGAVGVVIDMGLLLVFDLFQNF